MRNHFAMFNAQAGTPIFSIDPSYLAMIKPFVDRAAAEKKEVLLVLDFDDTILKFEESYYKKTSVINECLVDFLANLFAQHPTVQFKMIILSARTPDCEIRDEMDRCLLVSTALPVFLALLNTKLALIDKVISIEDRHIYCIQGNEGFVKRIYC